MHSVIEIDDRILAVEFRVYLGSRGSYSTPPEPGDMTVLTVSENGRTVTDVDLDEVESRCWDSLSRDDDD
jgi:hypothetical protein